MIDTMLATTRPTMKRNSIVRKFIDRMNVA